jgi:folate-binding protein YgfZ
MNREAYDALKEGAACIDLAGRGKIRATGDDRARLLHSMTTNSIQTLVPGEGCYAFFLTAQGRIISDANIFAMPDYFLIDTEPQAARTLFDHLEKYIIADDVTLHDFTKDYSTLSVEGPNAESVLKTFHVPAAHLPGAIAEWHHSEIAHVSYTGQPGYFIFVPCEHVDEIKAKLKAAGVMEADLGTADVVRIENGKPRYGVDITDSSLPQETQLMHAVHPSKGCYLGQEIVERVRSRGHVNRLLVRLEIEVLEPPAPGTKIQVDGKEVGTITSAAFSPALQETVALGILRNEAISADLRVGEARAKVRTAAN